VTELATLATPATRLRNADRNPTFSLASDLLDSFRHPGFWAYSSWLDMVVRYRQSRLGLLWLVAPSIIYIWGMGTFFSGISGAALHQFTCYVAVGWLVFRVLQSVLTESTSSFSGAHSFILDGQLRLTDFILKAIAKALMYFVLSLPVALPALLMDSRVQGWGLALALVTFPIVVANALWMAILLAMVGARFRDVGQLINNLFMFAFLLTPIIWPASSMPAGTIRGEIMRVNPFYHLVEFVRAPILGEPLHRSTLLFVAAALVLGWCVTAIAYRRYARFVPLWI
jgi:ABC-2 type transport system permease protein